MQPPFLRTMLLCCTVCAQLLACPTSEVPVNAFAFQCCFAKRKCSALCFQQFGDKMNI